MKHFPRLKTARLSVQLRELTIGQEIKIAGFVGNEEAERTEFLRSAIADDGIDPSMWTVQERIHVSAYYLAITRTDGPDFAVGEHRYSDYLDAESDTDVMTVPAGDVGGDHWTLRHLTGAMVETIENLIGEIDIPRQCHWIQYHWMLGAMAAQLVRDGETDAIEPGSAHYDRWLLARMQIINAFPSSDFEALLAAYYSARAELHHLFDFDFSDDGIVILPRQGGAGIPPARFPIRRGLSQTAIAMAGKSGGFG